MKEQKVKSKILYRELPIELVQSQDPVEQVIDIENRTVTFPFSSEYPVEREYFDPEEGGFIRAYEVLDHSGDMQFERLVQAGPLLVNHDKNDVVGVVEKAWSDASRGLVSVKFGKSSRASEIFQDVIDGIRRTVSFGYRVLEAVRQEAEEGLPTMLIKSWEPFEVTLESIPADPSVGVGRTEDEDDENDLIIHIEENQKREQEIPVVTVKESKMENQEYIAKGIKAERKRLNELRKIADNVRHILPEIDSLKTEFENSEKTIDEFNAAIVRKMDEVKLDAIENRDTPDLGLSTKEKQTYSLMRVADALSTGNWKEAGFELECSRAQAVINGVEARGAFIPLDILSRADAYAVTSKTSHASGLVPTEFWGSQYIDVLRANSVVAAMGAKILPGLVGDVDIPKAVNEGTFSWLSEGGDNVTNPTYSATTISLSPQDIGGALGFTRKMQKQTGNPAIESLLQDTLNTGIGIFLDKQVLQGTQTGASGLTTHADTNTVATAVTWASIVNLEAAVGSANAETGSLGYVTSPFVRGLMKQKPQATGATMGGFLMAADGSVNGHKCMVTSHADATVGSVGTLFYGNWADIMIPMWGGVDLVVDTATNILSGGVVLRAFLATDIAFRNNESFAIQTTIAG